MRQKCMLEENKICDNCLECDICDLDSQKICDNCAKCIETGAHYRVIEIDDIIMTEDLKRKLKILEEQREKKSQ